MYVALTRARVVCLRVCFSLDLSQDGQWEPGLLLQDQEICKYQMYHERFHLRFPNLDQVLHASTYNGSVEAHCYVEQCSWLINFNHSTLIQLSSSGHFDHVDLH